MSTFTAGPWCVRDIPSKERYVGPSSDGGAPSVAIIPARSSRSDAEQAANAKLIAAAPELLSILNALCFVDSSDRKAELHGYARGSPRDTLWKSARAAIKRATGEQP